MNPHIERFLALVTGTPRPGTRDEERQAAVRADLMERLQDHRPGPGALTLEEATARLESRPATFWLGLRALLVVLAPLAVLLYAAYVELPNYYVADGAPEWLPGFLRQRVEQRQASLATRPLPEPLSTSLTSHFPTLPQEPPRPADLSDPESLQAENQAKTARDGVVPPDLIAAWQKVDPDNAWLLLHQASFLGGKAIEYVYGKGKTITDPNAARQAMELCEQAARLPKYTTYLRRRYGRQRDAVRRPETLNEAAAIFSLMPRQEPDSSSSDHLGDFFQIQAEELVAKGDLPALVPVINLARRLSILRSLQPGASAEEYIALPGCISRSMEKILTPAAPCEALDIVRDFYGRQRSVSTRAAKSMMNSQRQSRDGLKAGFYPVVPFQDVSYHAVRQVERADAGRAIAFCVALGSSVVVLLFVVPFALAQRQRGVARAARNLARLYDWTACGRIFLFGFALPLLGWWLLIWHTRLGGRDLPLELFRTDALHQFSWLGQMLAAPLLVWTAALQWARVERARHFAFLGLRPAFLRTGWLAVALAALIAPLYGAVRWFPATEQAGPYLQIVAAVQGGLILWLLWRLIAGGFTPRSGMLGSILSAWLVLPVLSALALAAGLCVFVCQASERQGMARLPYLIRAEGPGSYETYRSSYRDLMRAEFADELK
ncbi:MAG: hypothetical protein JWO82_2609 [Akkermansiaceae bacterium]|nr:hypothetical protein [Akkermansiaceae bacterium]